MDSGDFAEKLKSSKDMRLERLGKRNGIGDGDAVEPLRLCFDSEKARNVHPFCTESVSPRTPKADVFDPFAPAIADMILAPLPKKCYDELQNRVSRLLRADSCLGSLADGNGNESDVDSVFEGKMFELMHKNMLEFIVTKQAEAVIVELSSMSLDSDGSKASSCAPFIPPVAESGRSAAVDTSRKLRKIDMSLCRKLEF